MEDSKKYVFELINTSNNGYITSAELYNFLILIEPDITLNNVVAMINRYDTTDTSTLNYDDFSTAMGNSFSNSDITIAFNSLFKNNDVENNLLLYFNVLQLTSFYNLSVTQYLDLITVMTGTSVNDLIKLLKFLNIPIE
jgi:Ca2+-binding EF-hand superfamily protein